MKSEEAFKSASIPLKPLLTFLFTNYNDQLYPSVTVDDTTVCGILLGNTSIFNNTMIFDQIYVIADFPNINTIYNTKIP